MDAGGVGVAPIQKAAKTALVIIVENSFHLEISG